MTPRRRLRKLEARWPAPGPLEPMELSDLEWLAILSQPQFHGLAQLEPDFPKALNEYRRCIEEVQRLAPEIDPPHDFAPRNPRRVPKLHTWRSDLRFEELWEAYYRLRWMTIAIATKVLPQAPTTHLPRVA
jgi:hypothetical protein